MRIQSEVQVRQQTCVIAYSAQYPPVAIYMCLSAGMDDESVDALLLVRYSQMHCTSWCAHVVISDRRQGIPVPEAERSRHAAVMRGCGCRNNHPLPSELSTLQSELGLPSRAGAVSPMSEDSFAGSFPDQDEAPMVKQPPLQVRRHSTGWQRKILILRPAAVSVVVGRYLQHGLCMRSISSFQHCGKAGVVLLVCWCCSQELIRNICATYK